MQKIKIKKGEGFTLVETLIYIAILGGLMAYFISFSLSIGASRSKTYVMQEVNANARIALEILSEKIRAADDILEPDIGIASTSLRIDMPSPDDNILFDLNNGVLEAEQGSNTFLITSDKVNISNLIFNNLTIDGEKGNVRIFLTMEYRDPESKEYQYSRDFQTSVNLRK